MRRSPGHTTTSATTAAAGHSSESATTKPSPARKAPLLADEQAEAEHGHPVQGPARPVDPGSEVPPHAVGAGAAGPRRARAGLDPGHGHGAEADHGTQHVEQEQDGVERTGGHAPWTTAGRAAAETSDQDESRRHRRRRTGHGARSPRRPSVVVRRPTAAHRRGRRPGRHNARANTLVNGLLVRAMYSRGHNRWTSNALRRRHSVEVSTCIRMRDQSIESLGGYGKPLMRSIDVQYKTWTAVTTR